MSSKPSTLASSRLEAKINAENEIVDLEYQDRSKWYMPLIILGNDALQKSTEYEDRSVYHYEAAIAAEHVKAIRFENTNWVRILELYKALHEVHPTISSSLSMATVYLLLDQLNEAKAILDSISKEGLSQREYLLRGCYAEYYFKSGKIDLAIVEIEKAIQSCTNSLEREYLVKKRKIISAR